MSLLLGTEEENRPECSDAVVGRCGGGCCRCLRCCNGGRGLVLATARMSAAAAAPLAPLNSVPWPNGSVRLLLLPWLPLLLLYCRCS